MCAPAQQRNGTVDLGLVEGNDELVERKFAAGQPSWGKGGNRKRDALTFRFVKCGGTGSFPGDLELFDFVGQTICLERGRLIHQLEMKMRGDGITGISNQGELLTGLHGFALMNFNTAVFKCA